MHKILDRNIAPQIKDIESLNIIEPDKMLLDNGAPVYSFDVSEQDFVRIEFNFQAGSAYSNKSLVASVTNKLLTEGTKEHTADEIANLIDSYGAFFETSITNDVASVALITLNKYLDKTLPLLAEVIQEPSFEESEFDLHIAQKKNEFLVNSDRTNYIARINFPSILFGSNHSYGRKLEEANYDQLNRQDIIDFHQKYYLNGSFQVFINGKVSDSTINLVNKYFGSMNANSEVSLSSGMSIASVEKTEHMIEKEGAVQNALRIGKLCIDKKHEDFNSLRILNTILGGYFGSRLMTNIREDKGYTYGIGSGLMNLKEASFFFISSEVKADVSELAVKEILNEIKKLQTIKVEDEELGLVRNYLQGSFQRSFDGPFALLDRFKEINLMGMDYSYYSSYINKVRTITADELLSVANQYLDINELHILTVGKIN